MKPHCVAARMRGLWVFPHPRVWLRGCAVYGCSPGREDGCADARIMGVSLDEDDEIIICVWIDIIVYDRY